MKYNIQRNAIDTGTFMYFNVLKYYVFYTTQYFYTDPNKISDSIQQYKVNEMFVENGNVKLCSWEEVWYKLL